MLTCGYENKKARVEMIPLIDVVFLLLVFFIYAMLSMVVHRGLIVELPEASTAQVDRKDYVSITITKDNTVFVGNEEVALSGLVDEVMANAGGETDIPVFINGDREADLGIAIRILDLLRGEGIAEVSFECRQES
jgi:biopolymer transport protein ExbD